MHDLIPRELHGILSQITFDKARLYAIDKSKFNMVNDVISLCLILVFLFSNGLFIVWSTGEYISSTLFGVDDNEIVHSAVSCALFNILATITSLPSNIYYTFVIEEKHGFNKQVSLLKFKKFISVKIFI